jgi:N-acetyl-gamma-glutamyl-phosphate reductase
MTRVGIVGGSGYTGAVAARLVATHGDLRLAFCTSDKLAGQPLGDHLMVSLPDENARFEPNARALELAAQCDAVMLATSAEVSCELAPALVEKKKIVVDLSGAFRLAAADYPTWYGFSHPAPSLLERAFYGLPELFGPPPVARGGGALVSNPGCYPTASLLALAPIVRAGLVEPQGLVVDAKSGTTGAGRQSKEEHSFSEVDEDLRAYKVLTHQHTPEIARALSRFAPSSLTFTAHLLPVRRGILATCYARPRAGASAEAIVECLRDAYAKTPFVHVRAPEDVRLRAVVGTNHALVGASANADVVVVVCAIDNLLKGAAGQAVQNLNLVLGLPETRGLDSLQRTSP